MVLAQPAIFRTCFECPSLALSPAPVASSKRAFIVCVESHQRIVAPEAGFPPEAWGLDLRRGARVLTGSVLGEPGAGAGRSAPWPSRALGRPTLPTGRRCTASCTCEAAEVSSHVPPPGVGAAIVDAGASTVGLGRSLRPSGPSHRLLPRGTPCGVAAGAGMAARCEPGKSGPLPAVARAVISVGAGPGIWQVVGVLRTAAPMVPDVLRVAVSTIPERPFIPSAAVMAD